MAEKIAIEDGVTNILALKFPTGKLSTGQFGKDFQFSTTDGRIFYLKPDAAEDLHAGMRALGIGAGEEFHFTKAGKRVTVERTVAPRRGDPGGHHLPANAPTWEDFEQRNAPRQPPPPTPPAGSNLAAAFMTAIDVLAEAQAYAARKGLVVAFTGEDVRSTAISCYINLNKDGRI
jgi:hypothetical protein